MSRRRQLAVLAFPTLLLTALAVEVVRTIPVRRAVRSYSELISAANRQDTEAARRLCTSRYLRTHRLRPADEGGLVGLPRNIHKNFQAWRQGREVWLCPTNRVGPIYRFVPENGGWRFDGPIGILQAGGRVLPLEDAGDGPR